MSRKPMKSEGVIYPCDVDCAIKLELLSTENHWRSSESPQTKITASSKYETCSTANKIR